MTTVSEKLAEVVSVKLDLLDALTKFADLRLLRVVQKDILCGGVVQIDLADERTLGVVEMATLGLNDPPVLFPSLPSSIP